MLPITPKFTNCTISNRGGRKIEWIVIHYFGGLSTALECAGWFCNPGNTSGSADFCVDDNHIIQVNPDLNKYNTWHCGGGLQGSIRHTKYGICKNANSIGIEMRPYNDRGSVSAAQNAGWYFHDKTVQNAVDLTKYLMATYGINADHVIMHADVTGKYCPAPFLDRIDEWNSFQSAIRGGAAVTPSTPDKNQDTVNINDYIVEIKTDVLNVRQFPTTDAAITATVKNGEKFTIVQETADGRWGKLKSDAGWIYLNYTMKASNTVPALTPTPTTKYPAIVRITTDVLNVRKGPGTSNAIVMAVMNNEKYTIMETQNGWGKLKSGAGWIRLDYTEIVSTVDTSTTKYPFIVEITASVLNVRKEPSVNSAIVMTVKHGEKYTIIAEENGFGKLKSGVGWISMEYTDEV